MSEAPLRRERRRVGTTRSCERNRDPSRTTVFVCDHAGRVINKFSLAGSGDASAMHHALMTQMQRKTLLKGTQAPIGIHRSASLLLSSLELSDPKVYEPQIRALLGTRQMRVRSTHSADPENAVPSLVNASNHSSNETIISPCEIGFYHGLPDFTNSSISNSSSFNSSGVNDTNATDACAYSWNGQRLLFSFITLKPRVE